MASRRKRVLFLVPSFAGGGGGAERVFSVLLDHLDRTRFEPHLALAQARSVLLEGIPRDVVVHHLKVSRMRYALPAIVRLAWKIRPQTILSTVVHLNVMLVLAKPTLPGHIKLVLREATTPSLFISHDTRHPRIWKWLYRHVYRRADQIICLSDTMMDDFVEHFGLPQEKLVRIYNPVDANMIRRLVEASGSPYSGPGPHLVAAGRLRREKGFDLLLEAMPAVLGRFPEARLTILGEGPLEAELKEQAGRLGVTDHVDFPGFVPNPWPHFRHAGVFVLPSRFEGLPNALLEALVLGTPAVASECTGAIRELQPVGGRMLLVPPEDAGALAQAIISVCEMPKADPAPNARNGPGPFNLQTVMDEYSRLL